MDKSDSQPSLRESSFGVAGARLWRSWFSIVEAAVLRGLVSCLTTSRRCGERRRGWRASRFCRDRRLPNAIGSCSGAIRQHRFVDRNLILGPHRFPAQRSRAECPGVPPLCRPTAGGPDANASPGRPSEREFHCYPTLTASVAPPIGSSERVRWVAPAPPEQSWRQLRRPALGRSNHCLMPGRRAPTKQSGRIVDSEWHGVGESCAELIGHRKTCNAPSVSVTWIQPKNDSYLCVVCHPTNVDQRASRPGFPVRCSNHCPRVRLSLRKAACSSPTLPTLTGNPGLPDFLYAAPTIVHECGFH